MVVKSAYKAFDWHTFSVLALPLSHSSSSRDLDELTVSAKHKPLMDYNTYMAKYMSPQTANSAAASPMQSQHNSPELSKKVLLSVFEFVNVHVFFYATYSNCMFLIFSYQAAL